MFPTEKITQFAESFESIKEYAPNGTEIWRASNLMKLLGYGDWWRFNKVIEKSMNNFSGIVENLASQNNVKLLLGAEEKLFNTEYHYLQTTKTVSRNNAKKEYPDYYLTRLACYAVAMEADNRKPEVVMAKQYLLVLANKGVEDYLQYVNNTQRVSMRETLTDYENSLESTYANSGIKKSQYGVVKSEADKGFYNNPGGTKAVKEELGIPNNKTLYDYMPVETMINKAMANYNTKYTIINEKANGLEECSAIAYDQNKIQREHMYNMQGVYPEETMPAENITITKKEIKKVNQNAIKSALGDIIPADVDPRIYTEFVYAGYKYTLAQWCYINAVDPDFILHVIDSGVPFEEAIFMRDNDATSPILVTRL